MKKLILIIMLVIVGSTFTKTNAATRALPTNYNLPVSHKSYSINELQSTNATVEFKKAGILSIAVKSLPNGDVTDGSGNVIGYWVYDPNSGVLLIVLY
ncbi:MAG: hypothetical protein JWR38_1655 [Mucilaginibacter sp.]|nr:hypothetical protein [Mucilaginibacter sp.]